MAMASMAFCIFHHRTGWFSREHLHRKPWGNPEISRFQTHVVHSSCVFLDIEITKKIEHYRNIINQCLIRILIFLQDFDFSTDHFLSYYKSC